MRVHNISTYSIALLIGCSPILSAAETPSSSPKPPTAIAEIPVSSDTLANKEAGTAQNTAKENVFLQPYSAVYSTIWKKGISLKVEGKQTLSKAPSGLWSFNFSADSFIASLNESSTFYVKDNQIVPVKYQYKSKVLGKKRSAVLTFDWDKNLVRNDIKNKPWNLAINPKTLDKLSIQLQVRQDLKMGKSEFDYQIADGGHIKNWRFERKGIETIKTKLGNLSAIKVIRTDNIHKGKNTSFWFVPTLDYLLVKLEHKEDGESYRLNIDTLKQ